MYVRIALLVFAGAVLGGCGQRGALYLPDENRNVVVKPAPAASPEDPAATESTEQQRRNVPVAPTK